MNIMEMFEDNMAEDIEITDEELYLEQWEEYGLEDPDIDDIVKKLEDESEEADGHYRIQCPMVNSTTCQYQLLEESAEKTEREIMLTAVASHLLSQHHLSPDWGGVK